MRTNNWAIQISRSIYDSDIWHKPSDWLKIWIYILWNVNYWDTNQFKRWSNFFKYEIIALECWCSINTVNKCIKFLKEAGQVQNIKSSRGAILSVINYDKYQDLSNYGRTEAGQRQNKSRTSTNTIKEEGKERKEKKNIYGDFKKVRLTPEEKDKLIDEHGEDLFNEYVAKVDEYVAETGKSYKNHYLTIKKWIKKDSVEKVNKYNSQTNEQRTSPHPMYLKQLEEQKKRKALFDKERQEWKI